jgi:hypothetical protein
MTQTRRLAVVLDASLARNSRPTGADEQETTIAKLPTAYVVVLSVVVLFGIAGVAWWVRFVSLELTAVYAEGFRTARMAEE